MKLKARVATCAALLALGGCERATTGPRIPIYDHPQMAFVVVDVQKEFVEAGGRLPVAENQVEAMLAATNRLLESARSLGVEVVYVTSDSPPGGELDPRLKRGTGPTFAKRRADAFSNLDFDRYLRSRAIDHLAIAGVFADRCVLFTARGAMNRGYKVKIVSDGVAAASDARRTRALEWLQSEGAEIIDAERTLAEWTRRKRYLASR